MVLGSQAGTAHENAHMTLGIPAATTAPICLLHQAPVKDAREVTAQFKGAKYFGKADMYKGYFQLQLDEEAQELLAIRTPDALYYPFTLPFGPASGPHRQSGFSS